ncbi:MAG: cupredoxin domain-containing protein [Myxococcales bacterium]
MSPLSLALLLASAAPGADIAGVVHASVGGAPKADRSGVVVFVADVPLPPGKRPDARMAQLGKAFSPQLLVVPVGTRVAFPNRDPIEHNVFSRSPHATFDLGRYGQGGAKSQTFAEAGVVDVYCNVHASMVGHVVVVPGPWAVTRSDGSFAIGGVPPGPHQLVIWDRFAQPSVRRLQIQVPERHLSLDIEEGPAEPPHPNKFGGAYRAKTY